MLRAILWSTCLAAALAVRPVSGQEAAPERRLLRNPLAAAAEAARARTSTPDRRGTSAPAEALRRYQQATERGGEILRNRVNTTPRDAATGKLAEFGASGPFDYSARGEYLAAGVHDGGGLAVWETATHRRLSRLENSGRRYSLVAISDDGRWVAAVRQDDGRLVDLWQSAGRHLRVIHLPDNATRRLEFTGTDELQVVDGRGQARVYSVPDGVALEERGEDDAGDSADVRRPTARIDADRRSRSRAVPPTPTFSPAIKPPAGESAGPSIGSAAPVEPRIRVSEPRIPTAQQYAAPRAPTTSEEARENPIREPTAAERAPLRYESVYEPSDAPEGPTFAPAEPSSPALDAPMSSPADEPAAPYEPSGGASRDAAMEMMRAPPESFAAPAPEQPMGGAAPEPTAAAPADPGAAAPDEPVDEGDISTEPPVAAEPPLDTSEPQAIQANDTRARGAETPPSTTTAPVVEPEPVNNVTIHFATNRNRLAPKDRAWSTYFVGFFGSLPAIVVYVFVALTLVILPWAGKKSWAATAVVAGMVTLCAMGLLEAYVRSQLRDELSGELYGCRPTTLSYGTCEISVPPPQNRNAGDLSRPLSVWVFEAPENPERHFMLREVVEHDDKNAFYRSLSTQLAKSESGAALVFIHGYNVSFEDAIFRTAQLAVDLKFPGAPIAFSWPSYADPVKYTFDEQNAEVSIPALQELLSDLAARSGVKRVHIIAHSMGNRVLAGALRGMEPENYERNRKVFRELVLAAPDIDRRVFQSQVLPHIVRNVQHCTLYASSRDRALLLSRCFHNYQRLGETKPELVLALGVDTIDASLVDTSLLGHSYIGDVQSIVSDLHDLVVSGKRPIERLGLQALERNALKYWSIMPDRQMATDASLRR